MKTLRPPFGDGRDLPCVRCGVTTPDAMFTMCCAMPMCDNCSGEHGDCGANDDPEPATAPLLTDDEHRAVEVLGEVVLLLADIVGANRTRAADLAEAYHHVHALQNMILAQAAARAYPGRYRLLGNTIAVTPR